MPLREDVSFNVPPESVTPGQLYMLLQALNTKMTINNIQQQQLSDKVAALEAETRNIRHAWRSAGGLVTFVKYAGGFLVSLGVMVAAVKGGFLFWKETI